MRKNPFASIAPQAPPPPRLEPVGFDVDYFNKLAKWLNSKDNIVYDINEMSADPEKFIFHVKYYIDNRTGDLVHVEFNDEFTKIHVLCFFEGKCLENLFKKQTVCR
jgi:hypothetical protein